MGPPYSCLAPGWAALFSFHEASRSMMGIDGLAAESASRSETPATAEPATPDQPREGSDDESVEAKCEVHVATTRVSVTSREPRPSCDEVVYETGPRRDPPKRIFGEPDDGDGRLPRVMTSDLSGADDGIRTRDPHLGKVVLYQLSHVRTPLRGTQSLGTGTRAFNGRPAALVRCPWTRTLPPRDWTAEGRPPRTGGSVAGPPPRAVRSGRPC
jgi:hypothetical protein